MSQQNISFTSFSPDHTTTCAAGLAKLLGPGDVILLEGDVGAGKTHFARALIQTILDTAEDVPSPTFTLVQTYAAGSVEIWHADLYRLTSAQEVDELGLVDAFETDICLVEWPDRLGALAPDDALTLHFTQGATDEAREITATWSGDRWTTRLEAWAT
jgi:tRNA threonylcarbamoyladenosine biosynthesis protein TsaE